MSAVAAWWAFVLRYEAREMWRALPGPWPVKVALIVVTQAIPGPGDELLLLLGMAALRRRQALKVKNSSDEERHHG